ncbi:YopX family protein [Frisingicoccus sp.]|uniref:YopX family protein n=1 Tax=Frisingicoccus sp. TaxID=1918627 RepID=UPI002A803C4B|nr:YopX family protein [Frisingicoccus sp.]MDY4921752.1 YopX family protein [Frisingicoccus sp.]
MNREILFRAKKVDGGEWVKGYIVKKHGLYFLYDIENSNTCRQNNYLIEENTICQYTGENDKNGQEIFDNPELIGETKDGESR